MGLLAKLGADTAITQRNIGVQVALQGAFIALAGRLNEAAASSLIVR